MAMKVRVGQVPLRVLIEAGRSSVHSLRELRRKQVAETLAWAGLIFPLALSTIGPSRTRADILQHPLEGSAGFRGAVPIICLVVALLLARPVLRPINRLEVIVGAYLTLAFLSTLWSVV